MCHVLRMCFVIKSCFFSLPQLSNRFVFVTTLLRYKIYTGRFYEGSWASNEEHMFQFVMQTVYVNIYNPPSYNCDYSKNENND